MCYIPHWLGFLSQWIRIPSGTDPTYDCSPQYQKALSMPTQCILDIFMGRGQRLGLCTSALARSWAPLSVELCLGIFE